MDTKFKESLTEGALQDIDWQTPTEFPLCPKMGDGVSIKDYVNNISKNAVINKNKWGKSIVKEFALVEDAVLVIKCKLPELNAKDWGILTIEFKNGYFNHTAYGAYFEERGADKYFTILQGLEWTGGDVMDDYCC